MTLRRAYFWLSIAKACIRIATWFDRFGRFCYDRAEGSFGDWKAEVFGEVTRHVSHHSESGR